MADSSIEVKILSVKEGIALQPGFPSLSYAEEFFKYREEVYGLSGGFLAVYENGKLILLMPVNFSRDVCYGVYKDYTEPYVGGTIDEKIFSTIISRLKRDFNYKRIEFNLGFINKNQTVLPFKHSSLSIFVLKSIAGETIDSLLLRFNKKTRNQIKKARKIDFDIKIGPLNNIDEIYHLYLANMKRHGTPIKSLEYFQNLFKFYGEKCRQVAAYRHGRLAGINIIFIKDNYLRLQYNYSDPTYWADCVNNLLYYKMIEWGVSNGINIFDFGPSSNKDKDNIHFKLGYAAERFLLFKIEESSFRDKFINWFAGKKYNLKIRLNLIKKN